jgi:hypothetical protein
MYDLAIIGGGPTGLTLATYAEGRIAVFERRAVLGGCHRYDAVTHGDRFVEHGPRVYSSAYVNCRRVLRDIGMPWDDHFQKTYFSPELIDGKHWYAWLSVREIAWLTFEYLVFALFDGRHGARISVKTYAELKGFSAGSVAYLDLVCRFSDGAGAARYTLWEFLCGFDQHVGAFYVPKRPNDVLFETWRAFLETRGTVDVFTDARVTAITPGSVRVGRKTYAAKKIAVCVPPMHADRLLRASGIAVPSFREFARKSRYDTYWSVTFFGATWGHTQKTTPWGIVAMQYPFGVVSAAASNFDVPGSEGRSIRQYGTAHDDIAREIRRQLGFREDVPYAFETGPYADQAFMFVKSYVPTTLVPGIDTVGCHNGNSTYGFTSMESAVQNALAYLGKPRVQAWTASDIVRLAFWGLVIFTLKNYLGP